MDDHEIVSDRKCGDTSVGLVLHEVLTDSPHFTRKAPVDPHERLKTGRHEDLLLVPSHPFQDGADSLFRGQHREQPRYSHVDGDVLYVAYEEGVHHGEGDPVNALLVELF